MDLLRHRQGHRAPRSGARGRPGGKAARAVPLGEAGRDWSRIVYGCAADHISWLARREYEGCTKERNQRIQHLVLPMKGIRESNIWSTTQGLGLCSINERHDRASRGAALTDPSARAARSGRGDGRLALAPRWEAGREGSSRIAAGGGRVGIARRAARCGIRRAARIHPAY